MGEPIRTSDPSRDAAPSAWFGVVTIVMTLLGWSAVPLFIAHFSHAIDPWTSNGWRYGFSALLWAPVLVYAFARRTVPAGLWRASLVPALFNALGQVVFAWSFYKIDPATASFGLRTQIVFVSIGAYFMFPSERALLKRPAAWLGIALVLVGTCGMILAGTSVGAPLSGYLLATSAGLLFAGYGLAVRRYMHGFHPVTAFAAISQYTAAIMVALMLVLGREHGAEAWRLANDQFLLLLLSSIIGIALGHVFYYIAIARLGIAVSSGVVQLQPFCVAIAQYYLFNKVLSLPQWISGSLAVCGALLLLGVQWQLSQRKAREQRDAMPAVDEPGS